MSDHFQVYFYKHPCQATLRVMWMVFIVILAGASSAFLAWGPLNLDGWLVYISGMIGASTAAIVWGSQMRLAISEKRKAARIMGNILVGILLGLILISGGITLLLEFQYGQIPIRNETQEQAFERLWKAMDKSYPYFTQKNVNWQKLHDEYLPLVRLAPDSQSYFALIASMLKELGDSHTMVEDPWFLPSCCFARTEFIEGQAVVTSLTAHGKESGLKVGDILEKVEGETVQEVIREMQFLRGASTRWQQQYWDYSRLLPIPDGGSLQVTVTRADESTADIVLTYNPALAGSEIDSKTISFHLISPTVGYIRVSRFSNRTGENLVADFDHAINTMMQIPGLILDLRGNGGGDSLLSDAIAGRFLDESFIYGTDYYRIPLPMHAFRSSLTMSVPVREPVYHGKLVILMDTGTLSSSEWLIAALVDSGRAITVGRQTGGGSGNPILFAMPDGLVKFSTGKFIRTNGMLIEGVGFTPDYYVDWTVENVISSRDPDIEAAVVILSQ